MEKKYINENVQVIDGPEAAIMIKQKNDAKYFIENVGIKKVDKSRWVEAQKYEKFTWCIGGGRNCTEDRNHDHQKLFDNYKILPSILNHDLSVIELGCGPYTNLNLILPLLKKRIASVDLLDPLARYYMMSSPNCTYKNGMLQFYNTKVIPLPIEEFTPTKKYDLVVMINVLEHCFDIDLIFEKVFNMMNDGGVLIFSDKAMTDKALKECIENIYDAGHPIRISEEYLDEKLKLFKPLYSYDLLDDNGAFHEYVTKYVIVQK